MELNHQQSLNTPISLSSLIPDLQSIVTSLSFSNYDFIYPIFKSSYNSFEQIITNILLTKKSDSVLSYGNNNYILKVFLEHIIHKNTRISKWETITITFNGYIHTTEDSVLKRLCEKLDICGKTGFENYQKTLEQYFSSTSSEKSWIIIYYENFEHLMIKKKQILLYTLLEIWNTSKNVLWVGFTSHYNFIEMMEKRIRSRFSQKTIYITIRDIECIFAGIEELFAKKVEESSLGIASSLELFKDCLISENCPGFITNIYNSLNWGMSLNQIIIKIRQILVLAWSNIKQYKEKEGCSVFITSGVVTQFINDVCNELNREETQGSYYNLLKNYPKLHITLLICLCACVRDYKEKITINWIYQKWYEWFLKRRKSAKIDLTIVKKYLEELSNSNWITMKKDEKYGSIYEWKQPINEMVRILKAMESSNLIDTEMMSKLNII